VKNTLLKHLGGELEDRHAPTSKGHLKVHFGILPLGPQLKGLGAEVESILSKHDRGALVLVEGEDRAMPLFKEDNIEILQVKTGLHDDDVFAALMERKPGHVVIPELTQVGLSRAQHLKRLAHILSLLEQGTHVYTSLSLLAIDRMGDLANPVIIWPPESLIDMAFLRKNVYEFVAYDATPEAMMEQYYSKGIVLPSYLKSQEQSIFKTLNLARLREFMLSIVASHVGDVARQVVPETNPPKSLLWVDVRSAQFYQETAYALIINALLLIAVHMAWYYYGLSFAGAGMLLLAGPLITALRVNLITSSLIAVLQFAAFNYFYMTPYFHFSFDKTADFFTFLAFMVTTISVGYLAYTNNRLVLHKSYESLFSKALMRLLYDINYQDKLDDIVEGALYNLKKTLGFDAQIILKTEEEGVWQVFPSEISHTDGVRRQIQEAMKQRKVSQPTAQQPWLWCPLAFKDDVLGVMGIKFDVASTPQSNLSLPLTVFIRSYADLLATALRQRQLRMATSLATAQADRESLRSALLSSVSHDLKTPLVSIIGSLSTLEQVGMGLPAQERQELITSARSEAERLHHIIHNVLEVAKLESGYLMPRKEFVELKELLEDSLKRAKKYNPKLVVNMPSSDDMPLLRIDPILMGQVFYNLYDNAVKYAGTDSALELDVVKDHSHVTVSLRDFGPGLPAGQEDKIFDKFHRYAKEDHTVAGSGLGLSICRGIVMAHEGTITVRQPDDNKGGVAFVITLPLPSETPLNLNEENAA